jgi:homogentisate 1,2-dioxygenase
VKIADHPLNQDRLESLDFLPNQFFWPPIEIEEKLDFLAGLRLIGGAGDPTMKKGSQYS